MKDWKQRVELLIEKKLSMQIEKNGKVLFESADPMLRPLYDCITENAQLLNGAVVIDKIVGRAAALLCVLGKVSQVYTPLASESAVALLKKNGIPIKAKKVIPQIMNRNNSGPCPMEKMASAYESPMDFYNKLKDIYAVK